MILPVKRLVVFAGKILSEVNGTAFSYDTRSLPETCSDNLMDHKELVPEVSDSDRVS